MCIAMEKLKLVELCASLLKLHWLGLSVLALQLYHTIFFFALANSAVFCMSLFLQWEKTFFFYNSSIDRLDLNNVYKMFCDH